MVVDVGVGLGLAVEVGVGVAVAVGWLQPGTDKVTARSRAEVD